jgi:hypothetical protein
MHMQKVWQSRPTLKQTIVTLVVCLGTGVVMRDFTLPAIPVSLLVSLFILTLLAKLNYSSREYRLRTERDELYSQLEALTKVIDKERVVAYGHAEHENARCLLAVIKDRYEPKTKAK